MTHLPNDTELQELKSVRRKHSLSMYVCFSDSSDNQNASRIEYKNKIREAELSLARAGAQPKEIEQTLTPVYKLLENTEFRPSKHEDLAVFANPEFFSYYHLPAGTMESSMYVAGRFSTVQLESAMKNNKAYYVLALSRKKTRLYKGDRYKLEPVELKDLPTGMVTALQIDEYPHSQQFHGVRSETGGGGSSSVHDQSEVKNTDKAMALEFFRLIDRHIKPIVARNKLPLIIGGVENLLALYKKANSYPGLVQNYIQGNLDRMTTESIRAKAWPIIQSS